MAGGQSGSATALPQSGQSSTTPQSNTATVNAAGQAMDPTNKSPGQPQVQPGQQPGPIGGAMPQGGFGSFGDMPAYRPPMQQPYGGFGQQGQVPPWMQGQMGNFGQQGPYGAFGKGGDMAMSPLGLYTADAAKIGMVGPAGQPLQLGQQLPINLAQQLGLGGPGGMMNPPALGLPLPPGAGGPNPPKLPATATTLPAPQPNATPSATTTVAPAGQNTLGATRRPDLDNDRRGPMGGGQGMGRHDDDMGRRGPMGQRGDMAPQVRPGATNTGLASLPQRPLTAEQQRRMQ